MLRLSILFGLLFFSFIVFAAPMPREVVVNHVTKECDDDFFAGDECMDCHPPSGWVSIGRNWNTTCPENYTNKSATVKCTPFKDSFCCSEFHSGASGNCKDMIISNIRKECAFVDDINKSVVPTGWSKKPPTTKSYNWLCPNTYKWVKKPIPVSGITNTTIKPNNTSGNTTGPVKLKPVCASSTLIIFLLFAYFTLYARQ